MQSLTTLNTLLFYFAYTVFLFYSCTGNSNTFLFTQSDFEVLMEHMAEGWNENNAKKAADCFTVDALYLDPPDRLHFKGRENLFKFFGGTEGRSESMHMVWHHLVFDPETNIGFGEWSFKYAGTISHGITIVKIRNGLIANWREYYYQSDMDWNQFTQLNSF